MNKIFERFLQFYWFAFVNLIADYKNKKVGIFWHPLSTILFIFVVGYIFANIQNTDSLQHLVYVASGYIAWLFIASVLTSGSNLYKVHKSKILTGAYNALGAVVIAQARSSFLFIINHLALVATLILIFLMSGETDIGRNLIALPIVLFIFFIASFNAIIITSVLCVRYPDLEELTNSALRIIFLATPIMWKRPYNETLELYDFNIFYHFVAIYRYCFISESYPIKSFAIAGIATTLLAFIGLIIHRLYLPLISRSI